MLLSILRNYSYAKINTVPNKVLNNLRTSLKMSQAREFGETPISPALELKGKPSATTSNGFATRLEKLTGDKQKPSVKKRFDAYLPGTVSLQVLGGGGNGAPCSVYLFTDHTRYLFNCGEGTQRLAHEHKARLGRLEHIFVTRNTWATIGGLPGLSLTIQDMGIKTLSVHGPPHLDSILNSMKHFIVLKTLKVTTINCTKEFNFEDKIMTVKYVPLYKNTTSVREGHECSSSDVVIAYICSLKPRPGALILEKCVERGVPPGPLLGLLKNGVDVTLDNGTVVKSEDVSEPQETSLSFIILDIPTEEYFHALQEQSSHFQDMQKDAEHEVALVVHFSPEHILNNDCYINIMQKFSPKTQHIYLNSNKNTFSGYTSSHRLQYQLNQLNDHVFPLLAESELVCNTLNSKTKVIVNKGIEEESENPTEKNGPVNSAQTTSVQPMTSFHMRPRKGFDHTQEAKLNPSEYILETQVHKDLPALLAKLKETSSSQPQNQPTSFPKIIFLGTGSCIPNKTRNVSSILLQPCENSFILLDCGEGTLGQIKRYFGTSKAEQVVRNLNAIYVSHLHADHHIGLIDLLIERKRMLTPKKLLLLVPKQIEPWLHFYSKNIEQIDDTYKLISNGKLLKQPLDLSKEAYMDVGVRSISTCLVRHCAHSYGVSLLLRTEHNSKPVKVTYSGDSMPCDDLVQLGLNSTILIHEATMEDDLVEEAKIKMHSTISQAVEQGRAMQAEYIILTHFSQRYAKLPRMQRLSSEEDETEAMRNVAIAFDNMHVTLEDLQNFHIFYPALKALFIEHAEELEQKALKREFRLERKRKLTN